jgi:hypothetical protein
MRQKQRDKERERDKHSNEGEKVFAIYSDKIWREKRDCSNDPIIDQAPQHSA